MKTVSLQEADADLPKLIADLEAGTEEVVITREGLPVARLVPSQQRVEGGPEREAARARLLTFLDRGVSLGGEQVPPRDELYLDAVEHSDLLAKIKPILDQFCAIPDLDTRTTDAIIGYDENGLFR